METEFVGSNTSLAEVFFLLAIFFFFLLLLHHGSIQLVVCPMRSRFEVPHYSGINSQPQKKIYRDPFVCARGDLYEKLLKQYLRAKNIDISAVFVKN